MLTPAIRFVTSKNPKLKPSIQIVCHVKPGVNPKREGIGAVTDEQVEVCVAAQAREGEANKAVREVVAEALKVPKTDVEIIKGMKSREKTVVISSITGSGTPEEEVQRIRLILQEGITG